eukprot:468989_1
MQCPGCSVHYALRLLLMHYIASSSSAQSCNKAHQCIGEALVLTKANGHFEMNGYKSASGPNTSFSGNDIHCYASFACHSMAFISSTSAVLCSGRSSCSYTTINTSTECRKECGVDCHGLNSCSFSNITTLELRCRGYLSCTNAYIYGTPAIDSRAPFSLYQATIDSIATPSNTLVLTLESSQSAYGAKLICRANYTCHVLCYTSDACSMLALECIGQCDIWYPDSSNSYTAPITGVNVTIPTLSGLDVSTHDDALCIIDAWNFDDSEENKWGVIDANVNTTGPICCRGKHACYESDFSLPNRTEDVTIACDGRSSCFLSTFVGNGNRLSVFCQGSTACKHATISDAEYVSCTGFYSCYSTMVQKVRNMSCTGQRSCSLANITSNGVDLHIHLHGRMSGADTRIHCKETDECNIYCKGYAPCRGMMMMLYCDNNCNVLCDAIDTECPERLDRNATSMLSIQPTINPSIHPSIPTSDHSDVTTMHPTVSSMPAATPSGLPTVNPSDIPTLSPISTDHPSGLPTMNPLTQGPLLTETTMYPVHSETTLQLLSTNTQTTVDTVSSSSPLGLAMTIVFVCLGVIVGICICATCVYVWYWYYIEKKTGNTRGVIQLEKDEVGSKYQIDYNIPAVKRDNADIELMEEQQNEAQFIDVSSSDDENRMEMKPMEGCNDARDENQINNIKEGEEHGTGNETAFEKANVAENDEIENQQNGEATATGGANDQKCVNCGEVNMDNVYDAGGLLYCETCFNFVLLKCKGKKDDNNHDSLCGGGDGDIDSMTNGTQPLVNG